jgi:small subunit ribosomal protein S15
MWSRCLLNHNLKATTTAAQLNRTTLSKFLQHSSLCSMATTQPPRSLVRQTSKSSSIMATTNYPPHTSFSASFSFSPTASLLPPAPTKSPSRTAFQWNASFLHSSRGFSTDAPNEANSNNTAVEEPRNDADHIDAAALNIVESINRLTDPAIMSQKGRFKLEVAQIIQEFGGDEFNSGLTEVQIAIITRKIAYLSLALRDNRKDKHNIRSLNLMIGRRRKLLKYLIRQSRSRYFSCIGALGLRDIYGDKVLKRKGARKKYPPSNIKQY